MHRHFAPWHSKESDLFPPMFSEIEPSVSTSTTHHECQVCAVVQFVMKSGAALELDSDTVDEVVDVVAGRVHRAIYGVTVDGRRVAFDYDNVDYMIAEAP